MLGEKILKYSTCTSHLNDFEEILPECAYQEKSLEPWAEFVHACPEQRRADIETPTSQFCDQGAQVATSMVGREPQFCARSRVKEESRGQGSHHSVLACFGHAEQGRSTSTSARCIMKSQGRASFHEKNLVWILVYSAWSDVYKKTRSRSDREGYICLLRERKDRHRTDHE